MKNDDGLFAYFIAFYVMFCFFGGMHIKFMKENLDAQLRSVKALESLAHVEPEEKKSIKVRVAEAIARNMVQ